MTTGEVARQYGVRIHRLHYLITSGIVSPKKDGAGRYDWTRKEVAKALKALGENKS